MKFLVINGPNLNMLGTREVDIYGKTTLQEINSSIVKHFIDLDLDIHFYQSNSEGDIISKLQCAPKEFEGIVINPGAYSHYSIAILDAIKAIDLPVVEVHISNIYKREEYRKKSITAEGALGVISGFGYYSYILAIDYLHSYLLKK
jgi:3-dehydroquinate dehydratase-2